MPSLAAYYFVNDLPGSTIPSSRLREILERLNDGRNISIFSLNFLRESGLASLVRLIQGELAYDAFREIAETEKAKRVQLTKEALHAEQAAKARLEAEQAARTRAYMEQLKAERIAYESTPQYQAKMRNKALRERFEISGFVEQRHFARLINILRRLADEERLLDQDALWLASDGNEYFTPSLRAAFHAGEAQFFTSEYERTRDPWNAVNASGHLRKCGRSLQAKELIQSINLNHLKNPKLRSAIATTHGGVLRDLNELEAALALGSQAHDLTPKDFRPCTLLGAVHFELGNLELGHKWYEQAVKRGAQQRSIESDLRGILLRAPSIKRKEIEEFLLRQDHTRYQWVTRFRTTSTATLVHKE